MLAVLRNIDILVDTAWNVPHSSTERFTTAKAGMFENLKQFYQQSSSISLIMQILPSGTSSNIDITHLGYWSFIQIAGLMLTFIICV